MQSFSNQSPSPTKRSNFRSKTKLRELGSTMESKLKTMPSFYVYVKDFPLDTGEEVLGIVRTLQPTHNNYLQNLDNLRLYKPQLAALFEDNWADFMTVLKAVVVKMMRRSEKVTEERDHKITALMQMNRELENREEQWKEKIQKIEHLRELEKAQLSMSEAELEVVGNEMRQIYKLLQGNMGKITTYLTKLEQDRVIAQEQGTNDMFASLKTLSLLMASIDNEQRNSHGTLTHMRELIKSMAKCSKVSTATQVDQSELLTQAGAIFNQASETLPFDLADASSANVTAASGGHLIDQLKIKSQQVAPQNFKLKHAEKPWGLTPTLLAFLQNMSKNNENGKVLPWDYTKQLIELIYSQRQAQQSQIAVGGIGNSMQFDEFVVFYFLHKHRIRRLAEVKLLEFIISLKYYSRYWPKAEMFCQLMGIMRYHPLFDNPDAFPYHLDFNTHNFFFNLHRKINSYPLVQDEGATYVPLKQVKKLMRASLYFTDQANRSRLLAKLDKGVRVLEGSEHCDLDFAMSLMLDEYLATKKRICNSLTRAFSKKFEQNQGYFSIDDMKDLFTEQAFLYRAADDMQYRFPIRSDLQLAKLYLYTVTAGKNGYEFNLNHFILAAQRYGFDAPFPFLHSCPKGKRNKEENSAQLFQQKQTQDDRKNQERVFVPQQEALPGETVQVKDESSISKERINVGVKIFSQHFSLLRELYSYVDIFSKTLKDEKDPAILWKNFDQIKQILQRGCEFMRYPLLNQSAK